MAKNTVEVEKLVDELMDEESMGEFVDEPKVENPIDPEEGVLVGGEVVKEKRSLSSTSKKALDTMVNQLELEDWEIAELGKKEKFNKDGEIVITYSAMMTKESVVPV